MIAAALDHIAAYLNQALRRRFLVDEDFAVVAPVTETDGSAAIHVANKLAIFLVNIERDTVAHAGPGNSSASRALQRPMPIYLNLRMMIAASFGASNYREALKLLSNAISLLQIQSVFDRQNTPELDPRLDKLIVDLESLSSNDLSNLWGVLGGRYLPSALYRVRMVAYDSTAISARVPVISGTDSGIVPRGN
ncbi:DUF4255 domain-containing protein [Derxia lacustris]|uniref:DUF4255 domain-containing protein n=1 Tax=Derxia lacustris TaxID=764842 RepID=UPI000A16FA1C|nr:DUF4255 domain-containing protein [Derxia lacustris]